MHKEIQIKRGEMLDKIIQYQMRKITTNEVSNFLKEYTTELLDFDKNKPPAMSDIQLENITVKGELLFELASKRQWINRVPSILPNKTRGGEQWLWVDKNGNVFECGADFSAAEKADTYPCRVYRLQSVAIAHKL